MNKHVVYMIELRRLADSPSQPRTEYNGLDELADSIIEQGILQPILVRPITHQQIGADPEQDLEIVAGHRRVRAARMAELDEIPAIIRPMNDLQVLQAQIVENLQREDVSPLDEGRAYAALRDQHGQTPKQIADTLGTSVRHVLARIQLLQLTGTARKALADGLIGSDIALLICAVPAPAHDKALELVTRTLDTGERLALPVRAARGNLRSAKLLHGIMDAPFDILAPQLIDSAGPCMQCPRMSTRMGDQVLEQLGADVCTDRTCYADKLAAHTGRELGNMADNGWTVLDEEPEFGSWYPLIGDYRDNTAKAIGLDPDMRAHCVAWPDAVTGLHATGVTKAGYSAMLRLIYPATPTPAAVPANDGGEGNEETSVATPRDTSDQEPTTLAHEGGVGAQEALRDEIAIAVMAGRGWPPCRSDLVLVCAGLAFASGDHALAMTGLPPARAGAQKQLDELHRWPDNRVALTATVLSLFLAVEELPTDSATNLLVQLHTRYLGGEGEKASHGSAVENQEDQPSLTAGTEVMDEAPLAGREVTDEAGQPAGVPTTTVDPETVFEAARQAGARAGKAGLKKGTAEYEAAMLEAGVYHDSQVEHDWDAGYRDGVDFADRITYTRSQQAKRTVPGAKYRDPLTGQTWSGRGLKPRWLNVALGAGQTLESFAVEGVKA